MRQKTCNTEASRGFTLIELMISLVVSSIIIAGVFAVYLAQMQSYRDGSKARERQTQSRAASDVIARSLRAAGFGMDSGLAFDFDVYGCKDTAGNVMSYASTMCQAASNKRDSATAPDEIVFYSRDLNYQMGETTAAAGSVWKVKGASAATLTLEMRAGDAIADGTILQVLCGGGAYTYVTAKGNYPLATNDPLAAGDTAITLQSAGDSPFLQNDALTSGKAGNCFTNGSATAYRINRYHYFLRADGFTLLPRTYLVLDTGTDRNRDGAFNDADLIPIASDVVDMQFAYVMARNFMTASVPASFKKDSGANGIWGDSDGTVEQLTGKIGSTPLSTELSALSSKRACGEDPNDKLGLLSSAASWGSYTWPCVMDKDLNDEHRMMDFPGNISAVRVSLISRTARSDGVADERIPPIGSALENRASFTVSSLPAGYTDFWSTDSKWRGGQSYMLVKTTVSTPCLLTNGLFQF